MAQKSHRQRICQLFYRFLLEDCSKSSAFVSGCYQSWRFFAQKQLTLSKRLLLHGLPPDVQERWTSPAVHAPTGHQKSKKAAFLSCRMWRRDLRKMAAVARLSRWALLVVIFVNNTWLEILLCVHGQKIQNFQILSIYHAEATPGLWGTPQWRAPDQFQPTRDL